MIVMTDIPIRKVLHKPDVTCQMVRWAAELSEFDVQYEPRGPDGIELFSFVIFGWFAEA